MILCERMINTREYGGHVDIITGIGDFKSQCTYDDMFHAYYLEGKLIPSVTQLLDEGDYANVEESVLEYAQFKGTLVHKEIQDYLEQGLNGFTEEFEKFKEYFINNQEKFKEKAIWDIKTYAIATPKNRLKCYKQIKMYDDGIKYLTSEKVDKYYLIHIPHNKPLRVYDLKNEFEKGE